MHAYHRERVVRGVLRGSRETVGGGEPNASGQHPGDRRGDHRHTMGTQPARRSREAPRHPRRCRGLKRRPPEVAQSLNDARKPRIRDVISAIIHNQVIAEHPTRDTGIPCIESSMRTRILPVLGLARSARSRTEQRPRATVEASRNRRSVLSSAASRL
jgi:hypothetical protein